MKLKQTLKRMAFTIIGVLFSIVIVTLLVLNHYPAFGSKPKGERLKRMEHSSHYGVGIFNNLNTVNKDYGFGFAKKMIKKQLNAKPNRKPSQKLPYVKWGKEDIKNLNDTVAMAIWFGHSTFYIKMNGKNILLDPMLGQYASPIPFGKAKRFNNTLPISIQDLPEIDVIVISHDHFDHLDYGSILELKDKTKQFIVPLGVGAHLEGWGVDSSKITELDWYENVKMDDLTYTCTPAQHFSGRGLNDKFRTLWCSWVIEGKYKLFFSGDSGYFEEFKKIGEKYGPFDVCMMECGQYDELWNDIHMFPEQTAQAHIDLKGNTLIPIHWGGFSLATHPWNDPISRLSTISEKLSINLATPLIGEKILIGEKHQFSKWWIGLQ